MILEKILKVYLDRGEKVLKLFEENNLTDALIILNDRNIAFANYQAAYYKQAQELESIRPHDHILPILKKISDQNKVLRRVMEHNRSQLKNSVRQANRFRNVLNAYGNSHAPLKFVKYT